MPSGQEIQRSMLFTLSGVVDQLSFRFGCFILHVLHVFFNRHHIEVIRSNIAHKIRSTFLTLAGHMQTGSTVARQVVGAQLHCHDTQVRIRHNHTSFFNRQRLISTRFYLQALYFHLIVLDEILNGRGRRNAELHLHFLTA